MTEYKVLKKNNFCLSKDLSRRSGRNNKRKPFKKKKKTEREDQA